MLNLLRNCQTTFRSGCPTWHSHRQWIRPTIPPHLLQNLLLFTFLLGLWRVNRRETRCTEGGKPCLEKGSLRGETKKLQRTELWRPLAVWDSWEVSGVGNWSAYPLQPQAHNNNSRPSVCQASQKYLASLQQPLEVSSIIIIPNFALEKEKAVGRKFNQGDKAVRGRGGLQTLVIRGDRALPT